jgi:hypothetical protein
VQWRDHRPVFLTWLAGVCALCGFFVNLLLLPGSGDRLSFRTTQIGSKPQGAPPQIFSRARWEVYHPDPIFAFSF